MGIRMQLEHQGFDSIPNPIHSRVCSSIGVNIVGNIISAVKRCNYDPGRSRVTRLVYYKGLRNVPVLIIESGHHTREVIIREAPHSSVNMRLHVYVTEKPDPSGRRG